MPVSLLRLRVRVMVVAAIDLCASPSSGAQEAPPSTPPPVVRPPPPETTQQVPKIEVTTRRENATDERRESSAAKIVVDRDEIEKFGDTNLADVLRRLPGGTQSSSGVISMRGMGAGFTQILIDGERVAPGFSIEQISPDQVERIEILRAPTAETGTRAIAGTINIILRKPRRNKQDDVRASLQSSRGRLSEEGSLSRNDRLSPTGTYTMTLTARHNTGRNDNFARSDFVNALTGQVELAQRSSSPSESTNKYAIQDTATQLSSKSTNRVMDAYALWSISAATKLRLSLSNLAPRDFANTTVVLQNSQKQTVINSGSSALSVALKLEMRL